MGQSWVETETTGCDLGDVRLNRRLGAMLEALGEHPGKSLPTAFQDWSNTKAAYRFFSNENVSEDKILEGHFAASSLRISATDGPILILQDTTEFSFKRTEPEKVGFVFWKLITNLPVASHADAVHKLEWYALRWKIETFFRPLKTGCRIEELRLATADRLANCIALCCVVAWRVSWLTMLSREIQKASADAVFTKAERCLLERSTPENKLKGPRDLDFYVRAIARLGGYLDRASDVPPGTTVIWRGLSRLADLVEGARIAETPTLETYG